LKPPLFRLLLVLLSVGWFAVYVPGHERGRVAVPGTQANQAETCPMGVHCESGRSEGPDKQPDDPPGSDCAVCDIVAKLTFPAPSDLNAPSVGTLSLSIRHADHLVLSPAAARSYDPRGPPGMHV